MLRYLPGHLEQLLGQCGADGGAVVLPVNNEVSLVAGDVRLGIAVVDRHKLGAAAITGHAELHGLRHVLLAQRQRQFALQLHGQRIGLEQVGGDDRALLLPRLNGDAGGGVGGQAQVLAGNTGHLPDVGGVLHPELNVRGRQLDVIHNFQLGPALDLDDRVWARNLLLQLVPVLDGIIVCNHAPGGQHEQRLVAPLVKVVLRIAHGADNAIGSAVTVVDERDARDIREPVVLIRTEAGVQDMVARDDSDVHLRADAVHRFNHSHLDGLNVAGILRVEYSANQCSFATQHLDASRLAIPDLPQADSHAAITVAHPVQGQRTTGAD